MGQLIINHNKINHIGTKFSDLGWVKCRTFQLTLSKIFGPKFYRNINQPRSTALNFSVDWKIFLIFLHFFPLFVRWFIKVLYCCIHLKNQEKCPHCLGENDKIIYGTSKTHVFRKSMQFFKNDIDKIISIHDYQIPTYVKYNL